MVVCPAVARRNAPDHAGTSGRTPLALLVVHGVLRVLGHDHAEDDEAAAMQAAEVAHLGRFTQWHEVVVVVLLLLAVYGRCCC